MGMESERRRVKSLVKETTASSSSSSYYLPAQHFCRGGPSSLKSGKQREICLLVSSMRMLEMNREDFAISTAATASGEGESKMRNVRLSMGRLEEYHEDDHHATSRGNDENTSDGYVVEKSSRAREEVVSPSIDLVTPHWAFLSNNDNKSNKEAHSFTSPPSTSISSSAPNTNTTTAAATSSPSPCASANNSDRCNRNSVSEEEIMKPLRANFEEYSDSQQQKQQQGQQMKKQELLQHFSPPHQSKALVLTHDQRKMKRRRSRGNNANIFARDNNGSIFSRSNGSNGNMSFSSSSLLFGLMFIIASLIHSSHEQSFFSPSSDDEYGGSFRSGTYGNGYTCVNIPVNFTLCKNIGYSKMMIPNLLGHDSLQEAEFHAKSWVPLLGLQCHPDTQLFLCSLFSPICLDRPIYPCRSLCQGVQAKCEPRMLAYNYPWPSMLQCDQFPEDHDLCIRPGAANKSDGDPEMECPSCNQAHTCENIVDNFCRADFVFRAKYKKSKGALVEFRKERWFKPNQGNRRGRRGIRTLSLDSKDDCCATKLRQGFPYIVMGIKRDDDYIITFAMQWNPKDKILKNAVRTFRSMDCTNPLPMSVTAAGGKVVGAERNGTTTGVGRRRRRKQGRRRDRQYGGCRVSAPGRNN